MSGPNAVCVYSEYHAAAWICNITGNPMVAAVLLTAGSHELGQEASLGSVPAAVVWCKQLCRPRRT